MAQKRMFDKAIIDTDRFMDLSMSAKALYFLLGMEADDEGFVSYKKVMRIHGGNEDDIKILVAKNFLLIFESGVVVITDWNSNNYLDKARLKPTEYQKEKGLLELTDNKKYVFNNGLTRGEESRVEHREDFAVAQSSPSSSDTNSNSNKIQYSQIHSNNNDIKETPIDEFENPRPKKVPKEEKVSLRKFQVAFSDRAFKELGSRPVMDIKSLVRIKYALGTAGLTEKQLLDLFDEWFSRSDKKDEEMIQITWALSNSNINSYKVRNGIK